jgi:hypothetical protein
MRILGVNGIHNWSWSKDSFTDRFLAALKSRYEVVDVKYPRMLAILAYNDWSIKRRAKKILEANKPGDILIAHSFGCLASVYAMQMGAKFDKVFFFGAAAEKDIDFPEGAFNTLYNIYSKDDPALWLGGHIPFHKFGYLGKEGYTGKDANVVNIDASGNSHNSYSTPEHICDWVSFIEKALK